MTIDSSFSTEQRRLADLLRYALLDTPAEPQFDDLAALASQICQTPLAAITLIAAERQWFKSHIGFGMTETRRDMSFCDHAIRTPDALTVIADATLDERFSQNPLVTGEHHLRFYAGMPLVSPNGNALGTLCVLDVEPRELSTHQQNALQALARQVMSQMELRRTAAENAKLCVEACNSARRSQHAASHDALTGLANRLLFGERVAQCIDKARKAQACNYSVMFVDLARFKDVNDSLGHAAGDLLLHTVACRLSDSIKRSTRKAPATVARFGGDTFMILLENIGDRAIAEGVAGQLFEDVARPFQYGGHVVHPNISVGLVLGEPSYDRPDNLLRDAESALFAAKAAGRAKLAVFDAKMHEAAIKRLQLEDALRNALERNELLLHYQPVVSLESRDLVGFEALVRWQRDGKLVSPADFIPIAEETGLIIPLGRWVMGEAIRQAAAWRNAYPSRMRLRMAVNVSRHQLQDRQLVSDVQRLLHEHQLDPSTLMLEITESVVMTDADDARRVLGELRALGVRLAMDDFGTGYSSLGCLHYFDIDVLKVDRMFVANLGQRRKSAVLRAVIDLAHGLGMTVVAEGIETLEQAAFLRAADCDYGQGYLFAKPLPAKDAEAMLVRPPLLALSA
ncbi:MAG: hypothetical protein JWM57_3431 [Phycisphaerales bacterium]|nr:hypothetical protein [Phycisphaerales bacterium]